MAERAPRSGQHSRSQDATAGDVGVVINAALNPNKLNRAMIADALGLKCAPAHWCLAESADDFGDIVFLKETDGGDAGGSSGQAGAGVGKCDAAQGQDRDVGCAGFAECGESGWLGIRIAFFSEDWGEDGEGGCLCCGLG